MSKKIVILGLGTVFIVVSCGYLTQNETAEDAQPIVSNQVNHEASENKPDSKPVGEPASLAAEPQNPSPQPVAAPQEPVRHYDTTKLDDEVREEALRMGEDPATYRKLVRIEPDGTKVYRESGMHVIVTPNSKPVFLPDML